MRHHLQNRVSSYTYALFLIGSIMMIGMCILCFYFLKDSWNTRETLEKVEFSLLILFPAVSYFAACIAGGYLFWGRYHFESNAIVVQAFLRKEIRISFDDIKDIGIDYIVVNAGYQFWIYVSKEIINPSFLNGKINKLPCSAAAIRLQYTPYASAEFARMLPPDLKKQFQRSESIVERLR